MFRKFGDHMISVPVIFLTAFIPIFLAELGDKTQLVILSLASGGKSPIKLSIGAALGFALIVSVGSIAGILLSGLNIPKITVIISGIIFMVIGFYTLPGYKKKENKESSEEEGKLINPAESRGRGDIAAGFISIVLMEIGDKTQLMTVMLVSTSPSVFITALGAWSALTSLAVIGAYAGGKIAEKLPERIIRPISAAIFIAVGIGMLISGF